MRQARAEVKAQLKDSQLSLSAALDRGQTDEVIGKMRVLDLLCAMPGLGPVRAAQMMERVGISETRRVRGLGVKQIAGLRFEFGE